MNKDIELEIGKVENSLLKEIVFDQISYKHEDVKVRSKVGEDCAVVGFGGYDCVISTDPITATTKNIGKLAINITCNDIASNGVQPVAIMIVALLPKGTTASDIEQIMKDAGSEAAKIGVEIVGGHTEITDAVSRPILTSTAFGKVLSNNNNITANIEEGDILLLTKKIGIEGTSIIASEKCDELGDVLTSAEIEKAKSFCEQISVVREGVAAGKVGTKGMHDVTEGGIFGGVWEMCESADRGAIIYLENIPIDEITAKICGKYAINPYALISSGSMLIVSAKDKEKAIVDAVMARGIDIAKIGEIVSRDKGVVAIDAKGKEEKIEAPKSDEIYKIV